MSYLLTSPDLLLHELQVTYKHTNAIARLLLPESRGIPNFAIYQYGLEHIGYQDYLISTSRTYKSWYEQLQIACDNYNPDIGFWDTSHLGYFFLQQTKTSFQFVYHTMVPEVWNERYRAYSLQQKKMGYAT